MVLIKCEDGTEYSQIFYTEDARNGEQKDEKLKSWKVHNCILQLNTVVRTNNPSLYISALNKTHGI